MKEPRGNNSPENKWEERTRELNTLSRDFNGFLEEFSTFLPEEFSPLAAPPNSVRDKLLDFISLNESTKQDLWAYLTHDINGKRLTLSLAKHPHLTRDLDFIDPDELRLAVYDILSENYVKIMEVSARLRMSRDELNVSNGESLRDHFEEYRTGLRRHLLGIEE